MKLSFKFQVSSFKSIGMVCVVLIFYLVLPVRAAGFEYDLGLRQEDIVIIPPPSALIAGQSARIYATVHNFGSKDTIAVVSFFQGPYLLAQSQPVSVRAFGFADEVFIDFTVPDGAFNILAKLQTVSPADQNPLNDEAITPLIVPLADRDSDGLSDRDDNCVEVANADQRDNDGDGAGDVCDLDDDNDGLADIDEAPRGTDPFNPDSDGDGRGDASDSRPLSASVSPLAAISVKDDSGTDYHTETRSTDTKRQDAESASGMQLPVAGFIAAAGVEGRDDADRGTAQEIMDDNEDGEEPQPQYTVIQSQSRVKIPSGGLPKLWVAAGISALIAGVFSFLALRMKTPRE